MNEFSRQLINIRGELGHKTAKSFFISLKKQGVTFNYAYYMRLEQGQRVPSEKIVNEIALSLATPSGEAVVKAYCQTVFPKFEHLFVSPTTKETAIEQKNQYIPGGQKELSPKQVALLASSESIYRLFLLVTLSRKPISNGELEEFFPLKTLKTLIKELTHGGIIQSNSDGLRALAIEAKFPEAYNQEIKDAYAQFDKWDEKFGEAFGLERFLNKMLIRRISGRYLGIIKKHLEVLFEIVKSSDETDLRHNDRVLKLKVTLEEGKLPG